MAFQNVDEAYKFYGRYPYEVGFPLKKYRESKFCKWLCAERGVDNLKVRKTSSKRTHCKAKMKLKKIYDDAKENVIAVRIDLLHLEHNHKFIKQQEEKNQLQCNKTHDPEYMEFIGAMQDSKVPHHYITNYVSEIHSGPKNVPATSQDMRNLEGSEAWGEKCQ
ncbi:hypothetical protein BS78_02G137200 [Paspalum vaginatum]|nr:hypothetical protein BS78_02G137200 [Paspalum vaginatum]